MMDLSKSYEFFQPEKYDGRIHIIGCGSVGSTLAENLARCGVTKMTLWDFDTVESHNIALAAEESRKNNGVFVELNR